MWYEIFAIVVYIAVMSHSVYLIVKYRDTETEDAFSDLIYMSLILCSIIVPIPLFIITGIWIPVSQGFTKGNMVACIACIITAFSLTYY